MTDHFPKREIGEAVSVNGGLLKTIDCEADGAITKGDKCKFSGIASDMTMKAKKLAAAEKNCKIIALETKASGKMVKCLLEGVVKIKFDGAHATNNDITAGAGVYVLGGVTAAHDDSGANYMGINLSPDIDGDDTDEGLIYFQGVRA